ncbi:GNAT family N-acetyltransferase [Olivibacter domesticus]|uniref:Protein N-acetyltransferase, RimJ/RimL family n=1 Tax=Olivibacter domesticus TaxID=407022 RepID=A0A1H7J5U3_OLID1|nr:GNAT family N-acetyltransferase [Olivibacter domesticus]SEK70143.1 Protein N-acetyltransferase, RimJ/RimL family [Olivibacter domesticus]
MNFNLVNNVHLENERVLLRPLQLEDYDHLLPFALNEPDIWRYSITSVAGGLGIKNYIDTALSAREAGREYPFIIFDKLANKYAGSTRFYDIQHDHKTLQLGYTWYGENFRRTGLNKHCKYLLLRYAFEKLGAERVEFRADVDNEASIAAMKSIGCTVEGVLRNHLKKENGSRRTSIVLSILKEEWHEAIKAQLESKLI